MDAETSTRPPTHVGNPRRVRADAEDIERRPITHVGNLGAPARTSDISSRDLSAAGSSRTCGKSRRATRTQRHRQLHPITHVGNPGASADASTSTEGTPITHVGITGSSADAATSARVAAWVVVCALERTNDIVSGRLSARAPRYARDESAPRSRGRNDILSSDPVGVSDTQRTWVQPAAPASARSRAPRVPSRPTYQWAAPQL